MLTQQHLLILLELCSEDQETMKKLLIFSNNPFKLDKKFSVKKVLMQPILYITLEQYTDLKKKGQNVWIIFTKRLKLKRKFQDEKVQLWLRYTQNSLMRLKNWDNYKKLKILFRSPTLFSKKYSVKTTEKQNFLTNNIGTFDKNYRENSKESF